MQLAIQHANRASKLFAKCGWTFNKDKSSGAPRQVVKFLGLNIDSRSLNVSNKASFSLL